MTALADRQRALGKYLMTSGTPWPAVSAAASVGNATQENMCLPVTQGPKDHGSDGLYQWRLERLTGPNGLQPWCASHGYDWTIMESQAEFHKWEIQTQYPGLWKDLIEGTKPLATLTANIMEQYERPAAAAGNLDARIRYAQDAFAQLAPGVPIPPAPAPTPAPAPVPGGTLTDLLEALQQAKAKKLAAQAALDAAEREIQSIKSQLSTAINSL